MPLLGMRLLSLFLTCLVTRRKESPAPESLDVTAKKCRLSSRLLSRLYSTERSVLSFPRSLAVSLSLPFTHSATQPAIARLASCKGRERTRERERQAVCLRLRRRAYDSRHATLRRRQRDSSLPVASSILGSFFFICSSQPD